MKDLEQLKQKYPLAVESLTCGFNYDNRRKRIVPYGDGFNVDMVFSPKLTKAKDFEARQDQIGEMLAELLNLIAKP